MKLLVFARVSSWVHRTAPIEPEIRRPQIPSLLSKQVVDCDVRQVDISLNLQNYTPVDAQGKDGTSGFAYSHARIIDFLRLVLFFSQRPWSAVYVVIVKRGTAIAPVCVREMMSRIKSTRAYKYWARAGVCGCVRARAHVRVCVHSWWKHVQMLTTIAAYRSHAERT